MAILEHSNEYQAFKRSNTALRIRVRQWPRNDDNDFTSHIPKLANAVRKMIFTANELRELVDKTRREEELNKCMEELSEGLKKLNSLLSNCLGALACTYHRLHGRAAPAWEDIERMWPFCSDNQVSAGAFKDITERIRYNDYLDGLDRKELEVVVEEIACAERSLHYLVGEGVHIKEEYEKSGRILADPNGQYQSDADDEESKV